MGITYENNILSAKFKFSNEKYVDYKLTYI